MNKEDKLILGTLAGVDLVLSPEHYKEYKGTLNKQLEEKDKEINRLNNIINELEKWYEQKWNKLMKFKKDKFYNVDYAKGLSDGYYKLKELKENK